MGERILDAGGKFFSKMFIFEVITHIIERIILAKIY